MPKTRNANPKRKLRNRRRRARNRRKVSSRAIIPRVPAASRAGEDFLKCAFAAPDFASDPGKGIPDEFTGRTLMRKDALVVPLDLSSATDDTFIMVAPTPGVAFWYCTVTAGTLPITTTEWLPQYYTGYFGGGLAGNVQQRSLDVWDDVNVSAFRYASLAAEVQCTSSVMTTAGAIQCWRAPLTFENSTVYDPSHSDFSAVTVAGLEGTGQIAPNAFTSPLLKGAYMVSTTNSPTFPFRPIQLGVNQIPPANITASSATSYGTMTGPIGGIGDMDALVFRVPGSTGGATNAAYLRLWSCVEYHVLPSSPLYYYASDSPAYDPVAIAAYRHIAKNLPMAVVAAENAGFWDTVLKIVNTVGGALRLIPGPYGQVAGGVVDTANGIASLIRG